MRSENENYAMKKYEDFLGDKDGLQLIDVTEPTDIIWENRPITENTRWKRRLISYVVIAFMLTCSGCAIFGL